MKLKKLLESFDQELEEFTEFVKNSLNLQQFIVFSMGKSDLRLASLIVPKELRKQGLGQKAMQLLNNFADKHGKRVVLTTGQKDDHHGTTSKNRLLKFYKRSGYVQNKGRNKDFSISDNMYRKNKVNELYDPQIKTVKSKQLSGKAYKDARKYIDDKKYDDYNSKSPEERHIVQNREYKKGIKVLGVGAQGAVMQKDSTPGEVIKISSRIEKLKYDGYFQYINKISKNNIMQSNSYFPKIYELKIYKHKKNEENDDKNITYKVNMEKLYSFDQLQDEEFEALMERIFEFENGFKIKNKKTLANIIAAFIEYPKHPNFNDIIDPLLKSAILLISKLYNTGNRIIDMAKNPDNLMFRRTSVGVQLVITDPLT